MKRVMRCSQTLLQLMFFLLRKYTVCNVMLESMIYLHEKVGGGVFRPRYNRTSRFDKIMEEYGVNKEWWVVVLEIQFFFFFGEGGLTFFSCEVIFSVSNNFNEISFCSILVCVAVGSLPQMTVSNVWIIFNLKAMESIFLSADLCHILFTIYFLSQWSIFARSHIENDLSLFSALSCSMRSISYMS